MKNMPSGRLNSFLKLQGNLKYQKVSKFAVTKNISNITSNFIIAKIIEILIFSIIIPDTYFYI